MEECVPLEPFQVSDGFLVAFLLHLVSHMFVIITFISPPYSFFLSFHSCFQGCCTLTSANCTNHGNPTLSPCTVEPSNPCSCDDWCGHGSESYDCQCNCDTYWQRDISTGACTVCNSATATAAFCNGRGTINADCTTCSCNSPWSGSDCTTCTR